jgi:hypothetical protein
VKSYRRRKTGPPELARVPAGKRMGKVSATLPGFDSQIRSPPWPVSTNSPKAFCTGNAYGTFQNSLESAFTVSATTGSVLANSSRSKESCRLRCSFLNHSSEILTIASFDWSDWLVRASGSSEQLEKESSSKGRNQVIFLLHGSAQVAFITLSDVWLEATSSPGVTAFWPRYSIWRAIPLL